MAPTPEDYKLRQMILDEWRAKRTKEQALKNIRGKLGQAAVTSSKVGYWYKRFKKGDTSIFNKGSSMHSSTQGITNVGVSKNPANSVLVSVYGENTHKFLTFDGRFIIFPNNMIQKHRYVVFCDLFHGVRKKIPSPFDYNTPFGMVGDFLLLWINGDLCTLKIDYDTLTLGALKPTTLNGHGSKFLLDKLNNDRFLIKATRTFAIGQVQNDEIVFGEVKSMDDQTPDLFGERFMGDILQGFTRQPGSYSSMKFCEINLETMEMTQVDAPIVSDNETGTCHYLHDYCWSSTRCYAIGDYYKGKNKYRVLSFDSQKCVWADIQITAKGQTSMFVDAEDVLTLQISVSSSESTFYRFANKKPDRLKNLAWFTILRNSKFFKGDIYRQIAHRLPYTCDLHCLIPD